MKCRLLYVVGQLRPGGSEQQLYSLLYAMDRGRYAPEVAVWNYREEDTHASLIRALGVSLYTFRDSDGSRRKLAAMRQLVLRLRPEVLHSYSFFVNAATAWAAAGTGTIAIGAVRSDFLSDKAACGIVLGNLNARWPRAQIYNSHTSAMNARCSRNPFVPSQISVVANALDLGRFRRTELSASTRVHILGIGSLLPAKRWDRLIETAARLRAKNLDFRLTIAGDGPLRACLQERVRTLGLGERTQLAGHSDDIPALLADATFLVHTSDIEGCPNAVAEAMAAGRAVVATDAGDVQRLVEDGRTGFVVARGDASTLEARMETLIRDRDLCRSMGRSARLAAEREFGLDRLVSETFAAYKAAGWRES